VVGLLLIPTSVSVPGLAEQRIAILIGSVGWVFRCELDYSLAEGIAGDTIAMMFRLGNDLLETLAAAFNPLPAIALLPLSLIWFGLGDASIIFVLVHSVLWAVALNTHSGFRSVSDTLRMVGAITVSGASRSSRRSSSRPRSHRS